MMETRLIYWFIGYLILSTFIAGCSIDHEVDEHDDVALKLKHELLRFSERFGEHSTMDTEAKKSISYLGAGNLRCESGNPLQFSRTTF